MDLGNIIAPYNQCPRWVKSGKARNEHNMSGLPPKAAEERTSQIVSLVPQPAVSSCNKSGKVRTNKSSNVHQAALSIFRTQEGADHNEFSAYLPTN